MLTIDIVNMICRYNSHPIADEIRIIKQNFNGIYFPNEVLFRNRMLVENKLLDKKTIVKKDEKQFNEKINKIYLFLDFCINSYMVLGTIACLLYVFGIEQHYYVLFFIYFYFYFLFLIFLIFFSLNISFQQ